MAAVPAQGAQPVAVESNAAALASSVATETVSHEQIARLAYEYWEARGYQGGCPEDDWFRAEQELRGHAAAATL